MIAEARQAAFEVLEATWSAGEVAYFMDEQEADRINWVKFLQGGYPGLSLPFATVIWGGIRPSEMGGICNRVYEMPMTVVLVDSNDRSGSDRDIWFMARLEEAEQAFFAYDGGEFQCMAHGSIQSSPMSEANSILVRQQLPYICAEFSMVLVVGETA